MIPVNLENIARVTGGKVIQGRPQTIFTAVSTDSRTLKKGQLFIALSGETYDAHSFLEKAVSAGAKWFGRESPGRPAPEHSSGVGQ
ncbi:MAG: Mur ligase domain-containing protein [Candidatus Syntrophopropionicum ammoniitolerans]